MKVRAEQVDGGMGVLLSYGSKEKMMVATRSSYQQTV